MIVLGSPSLQRPRQSVQVDGLCLWRLSMMAEPDSDTDSVVCALEDDQGEDPAEEDDRDSER